MHARIIEEMRDSVDVSDVLSVRREVERLFEIYMSQEDLVISANEHARLRDSVAAEVLGFGPIQDLINDDSISEIMVNGPADVWVEQHGELELTDLHFEDDEHVMRIINRIVAPIGRHVDESCPMVDARLPDGSRVNVIIPPVALGGPTISIRKFRRVPYSSDDLVRIGTIPEKAMTFLATAVQAGVNILVAGGTSTGKTTFLNVLSCNIPSNERIITIEDAAELQLQQRHVIRLESRPPNIEGRGEITIRGLVINALRMRPDRIVVGECRGAEALDMLQAMNTGHDGSMTTVHANGPRDALSRVEAMVMMAGMDLPSRVVREQITSAFDLVIYLDRMPNGARRVTSITEVVGLERETITTQEIFAMSNQDESDGEPGEGGLTLTGIRPALMKKIERARHYLPADFFDVQRNNHPQNDRRNGYGRAGDRG
jgi:pilus assembly protein CpaF